MTCDIFVKPNGNGFIAAAMGMPDCIVEAATRDEAIEKARLKVLDWLGRGEVVKVEIGDLPQAEARGAGIFAHLDDETWNQFLEAMKQVRAEMDADPNIP